jgi:hypothetical protein
MLPSQTMEALINGIAAAQDDLSRAIAEGRSTEEPDMTSRLLQSLEARLSNIGGINFLTRTVDSAGRGASESRLGADLCGVVRIEIDGISTAKGFLAQAKRPGREGLGYVAVSDDDHSHGSHWLYRGPIELAASGIVNVARPSAHLNKQCKDMLAYTPDSFVFVYGPDHVSVVSANAVRACASKPVKPWRRTPLGTKRLDDFFVHLIDSFIGDPEIRAWDNRSLETIRDAREARHAFLLEVAQVR